jgi:hypothetical protein
VAVLLPGRSPGAASSPIAAEKVPPTGRPARAGIRGGPLVHRIGKTVLRSIPSATGQP